MADYYLVDLIADEQTLELTPLDSIAALSRYLEEEAPTAMVSAISCSRKVSKEKFAKLYPNYFGDIDFVKLIEKNLTRSLKAFIRRLRPAGASSR